MLGHFPPDPQSSLKFLLMRGGEVAGERELPELPSPNVLLQLGWGQVRVDPTPGSLEAKSAKS